MHKKLIGSVEKTGELLRCVVLSILATTHRSSVPAHPPLPNVVVFRAFKGSLHIFHESLLGNVIIPV